MPNIPKLVRVEGSSQIWATAYDAPTQTLYVQFGERPPSKGGQAQMRAGEFVYEYMNVPPEVAHGLTSAHSPGGYHANKIKGRYGFAKLPAPPPEPGPIKVFIRASIPGQLLQAWNQHVRDFDTANPGCHFEVMADCPDTPLAEIVDSLRVKPGLTFSSFFPRKEGAEQ